MFQKVSQNPVMARKPGTFRSRYAANPDILEFNGRLLFYFRGQGDEKHDQMGVAVTTPALFDGMHWQQITDAPVIPVNPDPNAYDSNHILDPASAVIGGKVFLYYSAHSQKQPHSVALAISEDGVHFEKYEHNPIIPDAVAPEVVLKDGKVCLFYQRWTKGSFGVSKFYMCRSDDGLHFDVSAEREVMAPQAGCHSVSTNRIYCEDGYYYSFFGKNLKFKDYPESIGIARSRDLLSWEVGSSDVITRGEPGAWDEGALWFATVYRHKGKYYLWYEGTGTGNGRGTPEQIAASDKAVNEDYGGYGITSFSQIGMATFEGNLSEYFK